MIVCFNTECTFVVLKVLLKIQWISIILLSLFVIIYYRGTCSSLEMLKGYMVREKLGTHNIATCFRRKAFQCGVESFGA